MNEIKKELDNITTQLETIENLALLLEDYFYNSNGDEEFNKHLSLSTVVVEKIKELSDNLQGLYFSINGIEEKE